MFKRLALSRYIFFKKEKKNFSCSRALRVDLQASTNVYFSKSRVSSINILFIIANSFPLVSSLEIKFPGISEALWRVGTWSEW